MVQAGPRGGGAPGAGPGTRSRQGHRCSQWRASSQWRGSSRRQETPGGAEEGREAPPAALEISVLLGVPWAPGSGRGRVVGPPEGSGRGPVARGRGEGRRGRNPRRAGLRRGRSPRGRRGEKPTRPIRSPAGATASGRPGRRLRLRSRAAADRAGPDGAGCGGRQRPSCPRPIPPWDAPPRRGPERIAAGPAAPVADQALARPAGPGLAHTGFSDAVAAHSPPGFAPRPDAEANASRRAGVRSGARSSPR